MYMATVISIISNTGLHIFPLHIKVMFSIYTAAATLILLENTLFSALVCYILRATKPDLVSFQYINFAITQTIFRACK